MPPKNVINDLTVTEEFIFLPPPPPISATDILPGEYQIAIAKYFRGLSSHIENLMKEMG